MELLGRLWVGSGSRFYGCHDIHAPQLSTFEVASTVLDGFLLLLYRVSAFVRLIDLTSICNYIANLAIVSQCYLA